MQRSRVVGAWVASVVVHAGLGITLRLRPPEPLPTPERRTLEVRMIRLPPEPPAEPPLPEPAVPASAAPVRVKPAPLPAPKPVEPKLAEIEPPQAPEAAELPLEAPAPLALLDASIQASASGVEVSRASDARGGVSFGLRASERPRAPEPTSAPAPAFTPLADLSRKPRPPSLDALLRRNYPETLRRRGVEGQATVRANVTPRGRVARVDVLSESAPGFADACRRTLLDSEWTQPLDRSGSAVPTQLTYRCRFEIER